MRKGIIKHCKKFVAIFAVTTLITTTLFTPNAFAKTLDEKFEGITSGSDINYDRPDVDEIRYKEYLRKCEEEAQKNGETIKNYNGKDIVLTPADAVCKDETEDSTTDNPIYVKTPLTDEAGKSNVINWSEAYSGFKWTVNVPQSGYYSISVQYIGAADNMGINPTREIAINGIVPFTEATELVFKKWWRDESRVTANLIGDEVAPDLVEVRRWETAELRDADGYYVDAFKFYLKKGENTIALNYVNREMFLGNIILCAPNEIPDYATVSAGYSSYDMTGNHVEYFEAESFDNILYKSSNLMRLTSSKNTTVTPFKSGYTIINQVGGQTNWYQNRDSYTWRFNVPSDGLYKISLRVSNNFNIGMPVYRQIYVDGEIPFAELKEYKFKYDYNYYTETLSDGNGNPYYIYLKSGEHTLTMETLMGELGDVALTFYNESEKLNLITREIQKIIGDNPDSNYNYRLEQRIPELMPTLNGLITTFEELIEKLKVACDTDSSSLINELKSSIDTMKECIAKPMDIPERVSDINAISSSMGTWIKTLESSSLMLDFIEIAQPAGEAKSPESSFWKELENIWTSFIVSFSKDYNAIYEQFVDEGKKVIEVWTSRDRENADMMLQLVNAEFQGGNYDFTIKLRIVPGQIDFGSFNLLLFSLMSGDEPDMIWGCGSSTPVNFAIRGVGYNLEEFDDFDEVVKRFCEGTMISLQYSDNTGERNGTFGLPETTDMSVAFYRTDIFAELGISVPKTWDDVYQELIPAFYKENYQMPATSGDTFLIQMNGYPYRSQNRLSGWDTDIAYEAFLKQVNQYFIYGMDIAVETFQGFRNGTVPYMTGGFGTYTQLMVAAPELMGKWAIAPVPGTYDELGVLNRTIFGAGAGSSMMILPSSEYKNECWEFMKWWTSADVQIEYSYMVDAKFGQENRWCSANMEAFLALPWSVTERAILKDAFNWYISMPVILGDYQQSRYSSFAFNQVVIQGLNIRDSLEEMVDMINPELARKQQQYDIAIATDEDIANKVYDVTAADKLSYYKKLREEAKKAQGKG